MEVVRCRVADGVADGRQLLQWKHRHPQSRPACRCRRGWFLPRSCRAQCPGCHRHRRLRRQWRASASPGARELNRPGRRRRHCPGAVAPLLGRRGEQQVLAAIAVDVRHNGLVDVVKGVEAEADFVRGGWGRPAAPVLRFMVFSATHSLSVVEYLNSPPLDVSKTGSVPPGLVNTTETAVWPSVPVSVPDLCDSRSVAWRASMP